MVYWNKTTNCSAKLSKILFVLEPAHKVLSVKYTGYINNKIHQIILRIVSIKHHSVSLYWSRKFKIINIITSGIEICNFARVWRAIGAIYLEENNMESWEVTGFGDRHGFESWQYHCMTACVPSEGDSKIGICVQAVYLGGTGITGNGVRKYSSRNRKH